MKKRIYIILIIVTVSVMAIGTTSCVNTLLFTKFKPVYRNGDVLEATSEQITPEFRENIKIVLQYYEVPFIEKEGEILIERRLAWDLDTMWNYTTKANDQNWLTRRRSQ